MYRFFLKVLVFWTFTYDVSSLDYSCRSCDILTEKSRLFMQKIVSTTGARVYIDLNSFLNFVDERFVSLTLDTSMIYDRWPCFDFRSSRLLTLAKALSPGYLRLGGTAADFMLFRDSYHNVEQKSAKRRCDTDVNRRNISTFYMTELDFDHINHFSSSAGLRLIFDLNAFLRNSHNQWNSSDAVSLIKYAILKNYSSNLNWELGNEPNVYQRVYHRNVSAHQLADDYQSLKSILKSYQQFNQTVLIGPSVSQPKQASLEYLSQFLKFVKLSIDAISAHHYYIDGRTASVDEMMSVKVLDRFSSELVKLVQTVRNAGYHNTPVWLGETSSCWGGGAPGLSDTYVAGFMWLDKLGQAAKHGIKVVARQSFFHGHYALVDNSHNPNPDFWLTWLYKRLVGRKVLSVNTTSTKQLRVYAHCTNFMSTSYAEGAVTLLVLNLSHQNRSVMFDDQLQSLDKHIYWLLPHGSVGLKSKFVSLSGKVLRLIDNTTLPEPHPTVVGGGRAVHIPAKSYGFIVLPDANAPICLHQ